NQAHAKEERASHFGTDPKTRPAGGAPGRQVAPMIAPNFQPRPPKPREKMTPEELAQEDPQIRASIRRAHLGYCYATTQPSREANTAAVASFLLPDLLNKPEAPTLEEMWYSQMILWIEQDVVN